jgi:hypothetical protein
MKIHVSALTMGSLVALIEAWSVSDTEKIEAFDEFVCLMM